MADKWDIRFLKLAREIASWSKDPSTQTGAVIVRPDRTVASVGFNGFPKGMYDLIQDYEDREKKYSKIVHCEMNALLHCKEDVTGYTLYTVPFMSCDRCAVHVIQAGITRVVAPFFMPPHWKDIFRNSEYYFREAGVEVKLYEEHLLDRQSTQSSYPRNWGSTKESGLGRI